VTAMAPNLAAALHGYVARKHRLALDPTAVALTVLVDRLSVDHPDTAAQLTAELERRSAILDAGGLD
jgi:hypothetical protein